MTKEPKNTAKKNKVAKRKGVKKQSRKRKPKTNTGIPYEIRAQRAIKFLHQGKQVNHSEHLMAFYGVPRQFDVSVRSEEGGNPLEKLFEAKDYANNVSFEKVEAFETKLRELEIKPQLGGGMISRTGYQSGPLERAKFLGENSLIKNYYQLRELEEEDWDGRFKKMVIQGKVLFPVLLDMEISASPSSDSSIITTKKALSLDRSQSFLYDDQGEIRGNLLDILNEEVQGNNKDFIEEGITEHELVIDRGLHLKIQDEKVEAGSIRYRLKHENLSQDYSLDFSEAFSDLLKDCISNEQWFIPSSGKGLHAAIDDQGTILSFTEKDKANLRDLFEDNVITNVGPNQFQSDIKSISKSIFLRLLLSLIFDKKRQQIDEESSDYVRKIREAIDDQIAGRTEDAKSKYWDVLGQGTCLEALINLAAIYQDEDRNQSRYLAHRACELFPDQVEGFIAIIEILLLDKNTTDATEAYKAARILHDGDPRLMEAHAKILTEEGKYAEALRVYIEIATRNPNDALNRMRIARCEHLMGDANGAAWDAREAIRLDPGNVEFVCIAIKYNRLANRPLAGISLARKYLVNIDSSFASEGIEKMLYECFLCFEVNGDWNGVIELLEEGSFADHTGSYFFYKGVAHYNLRQIDQALTAFLECQKVHPDHVETKFNILDCYIYLNQIPEAAELISSFEAKMMNSRFYETKAIVSCYQKNEEAIASSILEYVNLGGDGAELSFRCGDILWPLDVNLGLKFIGFSTQFKSSNPHIILRKMAMEVYEIFTSNSDTTVFKNSFLEIENHVTNNPLYPLVKGMFYLLDKDQLSFESYLENIVGLTSAQYGHLISVASFLGWADIVLKLLEKKNQCSEIIEVSCLKFPKDKSFEFFAYLDLGDTGKLQTVGSSLQEDDHLLDLLAKAYYEYLFGSLENALDLLDSVDERVRSNEVLLLRWQILIELGKYHTFSKEMIELNQKQKSAITWWAKNDISNLNQIVTMAPPDFQLAGRIQDADHVVLLFDGEKFSPILFGVKDWLQSFTYLYSSKIGKMEHIPILMRARIPLKTVQSFRAAGRMD